MGLTTWENAPDGKIVKTDVSIAKNYLKEMELADMGQIAKKVALPLEECHLYVEVYPYCFKRFSFCWGARALVVFSVYSAIFSWAEALMSRLEEPMRKV